MKDSISITTIFQIFILFVLLFTAIMCLTINNSNAFGVKDSIVNAIESLDGNYLDGPNLNEEIVKVIQETSYRTSGTCPDDYKGFDRAGNAVSSGSSDAAVCIKEVQATKGLDDYLSSPSGGGLGNTVAVDDFVEGSYYKVMLFFQLDIPIMKQVFNFNTTGETRIIYNTLEQSTPATDVRHDPYANKGNLAGKPTEKGDDSAVNPVRNPGTIVSSGSSNSNKEPDKEENEDTKQELTCSTEGLSLDTKLSGVQAVTLGSGQKQGNYGLLFSDQDLSDEITRMTPGKIFTIQGTASGDDTRWYINYDGQCGWVNGANLGIDFGGNAKTIGAKVQMNITNNSSSIFKVYGQNITNVTGKKLYTSEMTINPLQYNFAKIVGKAALNANNAGDTLVIYETYRPETISRELLDSLVSTVSNNTTLINNFASAGYSMSSSNIRKSLSNFISSQSNHNRGCAVDVSLANKDMPSNMHEVSPLAKATNSNSSSLASYFTSAGAKTIGSEWWHFDYGNSSTGVCGYYYASFWDGL